MCNGPCTARPDCPFMQLPGALPKEDSCGKPPAEVFPQTMAMLRRFGDFLPTTNRALGGQLIEETT